VLIMLREMFSIDQDIAIVIGMVIYAGFNFIGNRFFVFRKRKLHDC
jgi:putative flippase GtrA